MVRNYRFKSTVTKQQADQKGRHIVLVRERGLEPPRLAALAPKASVSTNSTTRAYTKIVQLTSYKKNQFLSNPIYTFIVVTNAS